MIVFCWFADFDTVAPCNNKCLKDYLFRVECFPSPITTAHPACSVKLCKEHNFIVMVHLILFNCFAICGLRDFCLDHMNSTKGRSFEKWANFKCRWKMVDFDEQWVLLQRESNLSVMPCWRSLGGKMRGQGLYLRSNHLSAQFLITGSVMQVPCIHF